MDLQENIDVSVWNYPALHSSDSQRAEVQVLNQLYFVLGNGYDWSENGQIVPFFAEDTTRISQEQHDSKIKEYGILFDSLMEIAEALGVDKDEFISEYAEQGRERDSVKLYPIYEGSLISNIPDDVQDDYLLGAEKILLYGIDADLEAFHGDADEARMEEKYKVTAAYIEFRHRFAERLEHIKGGLNDLP